LQELRLLDELKAIDARQRRHKLYQCYLYQIIRLPARKIPWLWMEICI